ncbi:MAG TPA: cysteine desulfurase [Bacteroidetes bacterium]|nr:cysteine desulfurase [Bacteroidota bacterium]
MSDISHTTLKENDRLNVQAIRADFPILQTQVREKQLVYLDNGATAQKPTVVIEAIDDYYRNVNANIHRGIHYLSDWGTRMYEDSREIARNFLNAEHSHEIIFTKGTTDAINLLAHGFGRALLREGDEILISGMEHHSNIVPWHMLQEYYGIKVRAIPVNDAGELDMEAFRALLTPKVKLVTLVHVSNTLGTINPVKTVIDEAHAQGIPVLLDGAQAVPHMQVDVRALDVDFYAFSAHKVFGPTGTGILYGKEKWLNAIPPYQGGGDMIDKVTLEKTTYNDLPHKFEAGTPNIAGVIGMGKALEYVQEIGYTRIAAHEADLLRYATELILQIPQVRIIGTAAEKASVLSFVVDGAHPSDIGTLLDMDGIAVRTGHHCTQPLMDRFAIPATVRASFAMYNTREEVDIFIASLRKAINMFV